MNTERRINGSRELRASGSGDQLVLTGYAAKFNVLSHDLPMRNGQSMRERIAPGAFKESLANGDDVVATFNHDSNFILGRTKSGTLTLSEDPVGLKFAVQLDPNQQSHRDLHAAVKRGDIQDCSFAFQCPPDGDVIIDRGAKLEDGQTTCDVRMLVNVKLLDVSAVTRPAYPQTQVDARAASAQPIAEQITNFNAWWSKQKAARIKNARALMAENSPLDAETLSRALRLGYSEDAILALRSAAFAEEIRQGYTGADFDSGTTRSDGGQAADPETLLRDGEYPGDACEKDEHERAAAYHKASAKKCTVDKLADAHFKAAELHRKAAKTGATNIDSHNAREASKALGGRKKWTAA